MDTKWEELSVQSQFEMNMSPASFQFDQNLILICGGTDERNTPSQDLVLFNPNSKLIQKLDNTALSVCDKFKGGSMTQFIINRMDCKIFFSSEAFVHELSYAVGDEMMFKCKANLY